MFALFSLELWRFASNGTLPINKKMLLADLVPSRRPLGALLVASALAITSFAGLSGAAGGGSVAFAQLTPGAPMQVEAVTDPYFSSVPSSADYSSPANSDGAGDPAATDQQLLGQGNVQQAWTGEPDASVQAPVIAVVDSGVNPTPDLGGRLLPQVNFYPTISEPVWEGSASSPALYVSGASETTTARGFGYTVTVVSGGSSTSTPFTYTSTDPNDTSGSGTATNAIASPVGHEGLTITFGAGTTYPAGATYTLQWTNVNDDMGHGTSVATVAAGGTGGSSYATGVCPTCEVLPVRVGGIDPSTGAEDFTSTTVAGGIVYAASQPGVKVINLSLGGLSDPAGTFSAVPDGGLSYQLADGQPADDISSGSQGMLQFAVNYAISQGVTVVAAVGNYSSAFPVYPAADQGVLSVASVEPNGKFSYWTQHNGTGADWVDVGAPGCFNMEVYIGGFNGEVMPGGDFCGTSSSSPYVAGIVGLMYEAYPDLTPAQVVSLIEGSATNPLAQGNYWWTYTANDPSGSQPLYCGNQFCTAFDAGVYTGSVAGPTYTLTATASNGTVTNFEYSSNDPSDPSGTFTTTEPAPWPVGTKGLSVIPANDTYPAGESWTTVEGGTNYGTVNAASAVDAACGLNPSGCQQPPTSTTTTPPTATTAPPPTTVPPTATPTVTATTNVPAPSLGGGPPGGGGGFPVIGGGGSAPASGGGGGAPAPSGSAPPSENLGPVAPATPPTTAPKKAVPLPSSPPLAVADELAHGTAAAMAPGAKGWWGVMPAGKVTVHGNAHFYGEPKKVGSTVVALAPTSNGKGYWLVTKTGQVFAFGDAKAYGHVKEKLSTVVALAPTSNGKGYWLVTKTGQVFAFGDAKAYGHVKENAPSATTKDPVVTVIADKSGYTLLLSHGSQVGYAAPERAAVKKPDEQK